MTSPVPQLISGKSRIQTQGFCLQSPTVATTIRGRIEFARSSEYTENASFLHSWYFWENSNLFQPP